MGPPLGNLKGVCLPELFERQMTKGSGNGASVINLIRSMFWTQIMFGVWIWGQSGTSVKDQGSHDLTSEYAA